MYQRYQNRVYTGCNLPVDVRLSVCLWWPLSAFSSHSFRGLVGGRREPQRPHSIRQDGDRGFRVQQVATGTKPIKTDIGVLVNLEVFAPVFVLCSGRVNRTISVIHRVKQRHGQGYRGPTLAPCSEDTRSPVCNSQICWVQQEAAVPLWATSVYRMMFLPLVEGF